MSEKTEDRIPTIVVSIPMRGYNHSSFTIDYAAMFAHSAMALVADGIAALKVNTIQGTYIHTSRNDLAKQAMADGADYILWLDDDMRFPKDVLIRLLQRREKFVGVNYPTRIAPFAPVAIESIDPPVKHMPTPDSPALSSVEAIGFGVVLLHTEVLNNIRYPWFENYRDTERNRWVGEDVDFCNKARAAGYEVFVDNELSAEIAHVGTFEYRMEHAEVVQRAEEAYGDNGLHGVADGGGELAEPDGSSATDS